MANQIDVINQALIFLESDPITSIDDDVNTADVMRALFEPSRRFVLRDNDFNFARKYTLVTPDPNAPLYEETSQQMMGYRKPNDFIRMLRVRIDARDADFYRPVGQYIYLDAETAGFMYTFDCPIGEWDDAAAECLSFYLAYKAAMPITQSRENKNSALNDYRIAQDAAKVASGLEGTPEKLQSEGRLTTVRRSTGIGFNNRR